MYLLTTQQAAEWGSNTQVLTGYVYIHVQTYIYKYIHIRKYIPLQSFTLGDTLQIRKQREKKLNSKKYSFAHANRTPTKF